VSPPRRPDPEPMETDDVRIVAVGTALWLVALVAAVVFHGRLADHGNGDWVWVALAGVFLGFVGLRHVRRRQRALRDGPSLRSTPPPTGN
jgi:peptidoglycan/LPS O-acetylase OafA/YrhL